MNPTIIAPASVTVTVTFSPPDSTDANPAPASAAIPATIPVVPPTAAEAVPPVVPAAVAPVIPTAIPADPPTVPPVAAAAAKPEAAPAPPPAAQVEPPAAEVAVAPTVTTLWQKSKRWLIPVVIVVVLVAIALAVWLMQRPSGPGEGFISSNGRIEATEIDVATKFSGRLQDILVADGDFVTAGQILAHMQVQPLEAQQDEAIARHAQSVTAVASAEAQVAMRESDRQAALALVAQRESELDAAQRRLGRSETLTHEGAASGQELDDDRARARSVAAAVVAAKAQVQAAQAATTAARAQVAGARSTVDAAVATIARVKVDIKDSTLTAPRDGRVQYRIAQPGEVLTGGGKVLNMVDLGDVYMTFFVPETAAGKLALGSDVRLILDAAPQYVIPAKVVFVASTAQFTPKTVETASERQKLMFRVKAQISRELLQKNLRQIKTGLPGMAWLKIDAQAAWPAELAVKVPQ